MFPTMHIWVREASKMTIQLARPAKRSRRASQAALSDVLEAHAHEQQAAISFKTNSGRRSQKVYQSPNISAPMLTTNMATKQVSDPSQAISHDFHQLSRPITSDTRSARTTILTTPAHLPHIFTHLPLPTLLTCQRVCKTWNSALTTSRHWREQLYTAPAQIQRSKPPTLNPLLTTINPSASHYHPIHNTAASLLCEEHSIVLSWKGRFYRPEAFFNRASNPALQFPTSSDFDSEGPTTAQPIHIEWQLRELSRFEVCRVSLESLPSYNKKNKKTKTNDDNKIDSENKENKVKKVTIPSSTSSLWKMYLCQPPPTEIHVTVWMCDDHHLDGYNKNGSGSSSHAYITEKYTLKAWTLRKIFQRMDDVRRASCSASKHSKLSAGDDAGKKNNKHSNGNSSSKNSDNKSNNIIIVGSFVGNKLMKRNKDKRDKVEERKEKVEKSKGSMTWSI